MEDKSIFGDKKITPDDEQLAKALGKTHSYWNLLENFTFLKYPDGFGKWSFGGEKYGWSYTIRDQKRAIIYLLPRDKYFKTAFVFGQKATDKVLASDIADSIRKELAAAKIYGEGRGIRINVTSKEVLADIKKLIDIKLAN
jgi:hypothetical protein